MFSSKNITGSCGCQNQGQPQPQNRPCVFFPARRTIKISTPTRPVATMHFTNTRRGRVSHPKNMQYFFGFDLGPFFFLHISHCREFVVKRLVAKSIYINLQTFASIVIITHHAYLRGFRRLFRSWWVCTICMYIFSFSIKVPVCHCFTYNCNYIITTVRLT